MTVEHVRVPPDSTGKRIHVQHNVEIVYSSGTTAFEVGDIVVGQSSGATGTITKVVGTVSDGEIYLIHDDTTTETFTVGENLQIGGSTYAIVSTQVHFYVQNTINVGHNNPSNGQHIDNQGAASVRFAEGAPQFDAFGKMQVSQSTVLGEYINTYERDDKNWWYEETDVASPATGDVGVSHIPGNQGTLFKVGTLAGQKAAATTHLYHTYQLGTSQLAEFTLAIGDAGKDDVIRLWGYGDAQDGLFFRMNGTEYELYMRSSTVGDHVVAQADFNRDRLDGTGLSGQIIDPTKDNIYWIDFQWLGAGRVRFGVIINGMRITAHEMYHANQYTQPYIRTGSLPVHYGMVNTANTGSSSEMRVWCSVVKTEGEFSPNRTEHYHHIRQRENADGGIYKMTTFNWHPGRALFTIRPKLTVNGITNRAVGIPTQLAFQNQSDSALFIQARRGAKLLGTPTWIDFHSESHLQYNEDANIDQDNRGVQTGMWSVPPNSTENIDITNVFDYRKEHCILTADGNQEEFQYVFTCWHMNSIAGGADAGTYTVDLENLGSPAVATITRVAGPAFNAPYKKGVAFAVGMGLRIRNSTDKQNDDYYIITSVTADVMEVEQVDGDPATFITETGTAGVTLQGGETGLAFGSLTVEEII